MQYSNGDYTFVNDVNTRVMLNDAHNAVTKAEAWDVMGQDPGDGGFMFSTNIDPKVHAVQNFMKYDGHSGASYGWTMRAMQYIAKHGWDNYVILYMRNNS